jgi:hypothetical protein
MNDLMSEGKNGLSQHERRIASLFPENNPVDDKDPLSLFRYMYNLASEVNFYNSKNEIDGDWQDFFIASTDLVLYLISAANFSESLTRFEKIQVKIQLADTNSAVLTAVQSLFNFLFETLDNILTVQNQFKKNNTTDELIQNLEGQINDFDQIFQQIKSAYQQYQHEFATHFQQTSFFNNIALDSPNTPESIFDSAANTIREKVNSSLPLLKDYLKTFDLINGNHTPHIALLAGFIHLYRHLQDQINELPKKHLDFYYNTILGLQQQEAEPDCVNVFFEPEQLAGNLMIATGETLLADIKGQPPAIFQINSSVEVTTAKIEAIKMLYIARKVWFETDLKELLELQPLQLDCPVITPEEIQKSRILPSSWPIFGETEGNLKNLRESEPLICSK